MTLPKDSAYRRWAAVTAGFLQSGAIGQFCRAKRWSAREHLPSTSPKMRAYTSPSLFFAPGAPHDFRCHARTLPKEKFEWMTE